MKNIKVFNVEIEGIDKCGKDTICDYLIQIDPSEYMFKARGILSQIAYAKLYNRDIQFDVDEKYLANTMIVLLDVYEEDWKVRCKLTNEPDMNFSFAECRQEFFNAFLKLKEKYAQYKNHFMIINSSDNTPYTIAKIIKKKLRNLNNGGNNL